MASVPDSMLSQEYLLDLFRKCDVDNSGAINIEELQNALRDCDGRPFNIKVVMFLMHMFDKDENGRITFEEFGALWQFLLLWRDCFASFDRNGNEKLDRMELRNALKKLGYSLKLKEVESYIEHYDRSGSGSLSFDDFIEVCVEVSRRSGSDKLC